MSDLVTWREGGPPEDWERYKIMRESDGMQVLDAIECNVLSCYVIRHLRDHYYNLIVDEETKVPKRFKEYGRYSIVLRDGVADIYAF